MKEIDENINNIEEGKVEEQFDVNKPEALYLELVEDAKVLQNYTKKKVASDIKKRFNEDSKLSKDIKSLYDNLIEENKNLNDDATAKMIDSLAKFMDKVGKLPDGEVDDKTADDFFKGPNGVRDIVIGLKRLDRANLVKTSTLSIAEEIQANMEFITKDSMESYGKNAFQVNKFFAMSYGDFNMDEGDYLIDGISNVVAAYEKVKKDGKPSLDDPGYVEGGNVWKTLSRSAEKIYNKNDIFRSHYGNGAKKYDIVWDEKKIVEAVKNSEEWKVNNLIRQDVIEKEKKKKAEQELIAKQKTDQKLEEYAEEADKKAQQIVNNLKGNIDGLEDEEAKEEEIDVTDEIEAASLGITDAKPEAEKKVEAPKKKYQMDSLEIEQAKEEDIRDNYEKFQGEKLTPAENAYVYSAALVGTFKTISADLKGFIKEFRNAQVDKTANGVNGLKTEGPQDYQNILKQMYKITGAIDKGNPALSNNELGSEITKLFKQVNKYEDKHRPRFRGHRTAESAERYNIMERLGEKKLVYSESINTLSAKTNKYMKEADAGKVDIGSSNVQSLESELGRMYMIREEDASKLQKSGKVVSDYALYSAERKMWTDKITKQIDNKFESLDVYGFYNSVQERYFRNMPNIKEPGEKKIRNSNFASSYDIVASGVVRRELRKLKTADTTLSELKALDKKISSGALSDEIWAIENSPGYHLDMDVASILEINSKIGLTEKLVTALENNYKGLGKIDEEIHNSSVEELKAGRLKGYKNINNNLIYNIATAKILKDPKNINILYDFMAVNSEFNGLSGEYCSRSNKAIKKEVFEYIDKSGIVKEMKEQGKTDMKYLPELLEKIDDPQFVKGFTSQLKKSCSRARSKAQSTIRKTAEQDTKRRKYNIKRAKQNAKIIEKELKKMNNGKGPL